MKTGASVVFLLLLACSLRAQVVIDNLQVPDTVGTILVAGEGEIYMQPHGKDTLCHSTDGGKSWSIATIPRIWERRVPLYGLTAFPGGEALLTFKEWNASKDTTMLGLLLTRDAGQHWTLDRCPASDRLPPGANILIYAGDSIFYTSVVGGCLRSEDFGRTWTDVPALTGMQQPYFIGGGRGWAFSVSDTLSVIARTTDRGDTWEYDTLRLRLTGLAADYDGTVIAHIRDTIPPQSYRYLNAAEEKWQEISYPFVTDFDGRQMQWERMAALPDGRFLAFASNDNLVSALFLSEDAGARWTRLQHFRKTDSAVWKSIDLLMREVWRIGPEEFLVRRDWGVPFASMRLLRPIPTIATVENFSTMRRPQTLLHWSDPFGGDAGMVEIERSGADSNWTMIANSPIPEQQYLDSTWRSEQPVRYRVTLHSDDGSLARAVSDSVTPMLGAYVDCLDYLLPTVDRELRYVAVDFRGGPPIGLDTIHTTVTLRFLTPRDSTALLRIHPVRKIVDSVNGAADTTYGCILEYLSPYHHFEVDSVYPGMEFPMIIDGRPSHFSEGERQKGMLKADLFATPSWMLPDSLDLYTQYDYYNSHWYCLYRVQEGIGVVYLRYNEDGFHGLWDHREWHLIEHVNATNEPPHPASGLALASYPNPVTDGATVRYILPAAGEATLTVHDMLGRRVAVLAEGHRSAGTHHAVFQPAGLPSGTYLLRLLADGAATTRLISLIR